MVTGKDIGSHLDLWLREREMELEQNPVVSVIEHGGKPCKDFLLLHPYRFEMSRNVVEFPEAICHVVLRGNAGACERRRRSTTRHNTGDPMSWCKTLLTHQQVVAAELITLVNDFEYLFLDSGEPKGMMLFQGETTAAGYTVYFAPGCLPRALSLIGAHSGSYCETPTKEDLKYLGGDMSVLSSLGQ